MDEVKRGVLTEDEKLKKWKLVIKYMGACGDELWFDSIDEALEEVGNRKRQSTCFYESITGGTASIEFTQTPTMGGGIVCSLLGESAVKVRSRSLETSRKSVLISFRIMPPGRSIG